jgi:hypothetical protein
MTNEEIRIKVAEALGWKSPFNEREWLHGSGPEGEDVYGKFVGTDPCGDREQVPNYPFDLNACAEFEKTLTDQEHNRCRAHIYSMTFNPRECFSATARQRCIAYLKTKGIIP